MIIFFISTPSISSNYLCVHITVVHSWSVWRKCLVQKHPRRWENIVTPFCQMGQSRFLLQNAWKSTSCWMTDWIRIPYFFCPLKCTVGSVMPELGKIHEDYLYLENRSEISQSIWPWSPPESRVILQIFLHLSSDSPNNHGMTSSVNFLYYHWRKCKILKAQLCSTEDFFRK